jgi:hypothetical protein
MDPVDSYDEFYALDRGITSAGVRAALIFFANEPGRAQELVTNVTLGP